MIKNKYTETDLVRVSLGSADSLGLTKSWTLTKSSTAYLLTHYENRCLGKCAFCSQGRASKSQNNMLSRIIWPLFKLDIVSDRISKAEINHNIKRICIQAMNYPEAFKNSLDIIKKIKVKSNLPISLSFQPINTSQIKKLAKIIDRISIPIDATNEDIFERTKGRLIGGPYEWKKQINLLKKATKIFGKGKVTTHFIVGLGESDSEIIKMIEWADNLGIFPSLFAFTPIKGTPLENLEQPPLPRYRVIQLAHSLITRNKMKIKNMEFDSMGRLHSFGISIAGLKKIIYSGEPFRTHGCPYCDRPYYNERVVGPFYNYPKLPTEEDINLIEEQIGNYLVTGVTN
jgi:biotin synthase